MICHQLRTVAFSSSIPESIILIDRISCDFDRLKIMIRMQNKYVEILEQTSQIYIYSTTKLNSSKLGTAISEEVTYLI